MWPRLLPAAVPPGASSPPLPAALLRPYDVVLVCGPYKSGSSLLTEILAGNGYFDPSRLSNPGERGYGTRGGRYLTYECALARTVNQALLGRAPAASGPLRVADYLSLWRFPVVVKDPRFVFTLPHWLAAAGRVGKSMAVCFTVRPAREMEGAWLDAPFTRGLLRRHGLEEMRDAQLRAFAACRAWGVPTSWHTLASLRILDAALSAVARPAPPVGPFVVAPGTRR